MVEIIMKIIKSEELLRVTPPKNKKNKKLREGRVRWVRWESGGVGCFALTGGKDAKDKSVIRVTH